MVGPKMGPWAQNWVPGLQKWAHAPLPPGGPLVSFYDYTPLLVILRLISLVSHFGPGEPFKGPRAHFWAHGPKSTSTSTGLNRMLVSIFDLAPFSGVRFQFGGSCLILGVLCRFGVLCVVLVVFHRSLFPFVCLRYVWRSAFCGLVVGWPLRWFLLL